MDFFASDVERITGVQRLRLHHWMREGFLVPSGQVAQGHGTKNIYTREDLYQIFLLKKLLENGIHGKTASSLLKWNFEELRSIHMNLKAKSDSDAMALCIVRCFENGQQAKPPEVFIAIRKQFPSLEDRVYEFFNSGYDNIMLINLSKLIDEVDSHI